MPKVTAKRRVSFIVLEVKKDVFRSATNKLRGGDINLLFHDDRSG